MFERMLDRLSRHLMLLTSLVVVAMMLHVALDVSMKYLMNRPLPSTIEIVSNYYMVAIVFLPVAFSERMGAGITVDVFMLKAPRPIRFLSECLALSLSLLVYLGLALNTFQQALRSLAQNEVAMGYLRVPVWPARFLLPVAFILAAAVCAGLLWHRARSPGMDTTETGVGSDE